MNTLSLIFLLAITIQFSFGIIVLPYKNVQSNIAAGSKITIPISNEKFIISPCAGLGNSYLYTEGNKVTSYSPVAFFANSSELELYVPENGGDTAQRYFIVVELPLAQAIIKTSPFYITAGKAISVSPIDGCGKTVKLTNDGGNANQSINDPTADTNGNGNSSETALDTVGGANGSITGTNGNTTGANGSTTGANGNTNGVNGAEGTNGTSGTDGINGTNGTEGTDGVNGGIVNGNSTTTSNTSILSAESVSTEGNKNEEGSNNNIVIIACAGTSVVALVIISTVVFMRGKSYMKQSEEELSFNNYNYTNLTPKTGGVAGLYDNFYTSNSQNEFGSKVTDYQIKCMDSDNHSINGTSYPVSLSDGASCVSKSADTPKLFSSEDQPIVPSLPVLPITKHIVEETVITPEKVKSETINVNPVSAVITTASMALDGLSIMNSEKDRSSLDDSTCDTSIVSSSSSSSSSCSCSCSCSCSGSGSCSCSTCMSKSRTMTTNNESSLKLLELDFSTTSNKKPMNSLLLPMNNSMAGNTTHGYSIFNDKNNSIALSSDYSGYTSIDSRRDTNYTEATTNYDTTNYDDSRRMTNYTEATTNYDDSRRMTNYTEATTDYDDSRRMTNYTEATTDYDDSRRMTNYTEATTDYDSSRRMTNYTEGSSYTTDRDSRRMTNYTEATTDYDDSRRMTNYTEATTDYDSSRRMTNYTEATTDYDDSRRMTNYTEATTDYDDSRRMTNYTEGSSYTTDRDSRRLTNYTEGSSYTTTDRDSRRLTNYTEATDYTNRDSRYTEYTEGDSYSSYSSCSCSDPECDGKKRRMTNYSEYTTDCESKRYTNYSEYTTDKEGNTINDSQFSSDFCEAQDATMSEDILPK